MKYLTSLAFALAVARATPTKRSDSRGIDVSNWEPSVDWNAAVNNGIQFAYIMATDGPSYKSPYFNDQYSGAANAGLIRGPYHFARPNESSGSAQAMHFLNNGGTWSANGNTLPGALDVEYNTNGNVCYNMNAAEMVAWIADFSNTYKAATNRFPVIYTTTDWWKTCTGNSAVFGNNNPLWIADYAFELGELPAGWGYTSFWQYADNGPIPSDADIWNGDFASLQRFANAVS